VAAEEIRAGTVVRYLETNARWYIATVRVVDGNDVMIRYLGGKDETVDRSRIESLRDYLGNRERVVSLEREDLCHVIYGERFHRLPEPRLKEMQRFLRNTGLRFKPPTWGPGQRIRISLDASFVAAEESEVDADLEALLPRWLEPNRLPPGSRDPLGFQSHAERIANELLPGLTVFTSRIGYYGLVAWAVRKLNDEPAPRGLTRREAFHRLERTLALCEFIKHGPDDKSCRLLGQRSKTQILSSAVRDRFPVPKRILKNQEAAGAFRLYSTSLESTGFATSTPELAADELLPFKLTDLGHGLADEFKKRVPTGFWEFALSGQTRDRELLRKWGKKLCFAELGTMKYRSVFLEGFALGGSREAEARHHTLRLLFDRGLLREGYGVAHRRPVSADSISEEEAAALEDDDEDAQLRNSEVLLRFYGEKPGVANALMQKAAVFELLALALTAIFAHATHALGSSNRASITGLADAVASVRTHGALWKTPFGRVAKRADSARELEQQLMAAEDPATAAAIGGALLARVLADRAYAARAPLLSDLPVMEIVGSVDAGTSLVAGYGRLLEVMVARHEQVSTNKSRQRWCYIDGGDLAKDDLRPLGYGWHAMRFPQLWSLCRDLELTPQDLVHA
jgi:hypothetical protein